MSDSQVLRILVVQDVIQLLLLKCKGNSNLVAVRLNFDKLAVHRITLFIRLLTQESNIIKHGIGIGINRFAVSFFLISRIGIFRCVFIQCCHVGIISLLVLLLSDRLDDKFRVVRDRLGILHLGCNLDLLVFIDVPDLALLILIMKQDDRILGDILAVKAGHFIAVYSGIVIIKALNIVTIRAFDNSCSCHIFFDQ